MRRNVIVIDEDLCNGCGQCAEACPEGAIRIIEGKARLVSDIYCDGLGACIGDCPKGAISIVEREAEEYDERKVMENVVKLGEETVLAHLDHLRDHGETGYLGQALEFLRERGSNIDVERYEERSQIPLAPSGPHSARVQTTAPSSRSELKHWPVQLHLISPLAPQYRDADLVLAADCTAFSSGSFHQEFIKGRSLAIACPKLDSGLDRYIDKLVALIDEARVRTITVVTMEVPCCQGLMRLVEKALSMSHRKVPLERVILGTDGEVLAREWMNVVEDDGG